MKLFFFIAAIALLVVACGKDKFETKPQIEIKSVNTNENNELAFNQTLSVTIEYTDKEGDVSDSFYIFRERLNSRDPLTLLPLPYKLPQFPNTPKGEIEVNLGFQTELTLNLPPIRIPGTSSEYEKDTMRLKFVAKDQGGNFSDTAVLDNLIVERR
jgi:hypothetical protein